MTKTGRAKIKRLALRVSSTAFAEGVADAGVGDGPELDRRRRESRRALDALLAALTETNTEGVK